MAKRILNLSLKIKKKIHISIFNKRINKFIIFGKMKFITITILFALFACSLSLTADEDKWCGSSVVSVSIISIENGKEAITKAKLTVPVSLEKAVSHISVDAKTKQEIFNSGALIKKSQQGIIFTLDGPVNSVQLGKIYERDEDSENDIYIPYSFITTINSVSTPANEPTSFSIDLFFKKDFKTKLLSDKQIYKVTIRFESDAFKTTICDCMFKYFVAKIRFNWRLRRESLEYIRTQLFRHIRILFANYKALKSIQGNDADIKKVEKLKITKTTQETECSDIKITLDMKLLKSLEMSKKMDALVNPDCEKFDTQIREVTSIYQAKMRTAESDIINKQVIEMKMGSEIDIKYANSQVLEQHMHTSSTLQRIASNIDVLESEQRVSYTSNKAQFDAINLQYAAMATDAEIKYLENANTKYDALITYFNGNFWKQ